MQIKTRARTCEPEGSEEKRSTEGEGRKREGKERKTNRK